jgi:ABC-type Fe3+/spermidine/putrescine transport system ATPase subunit
MTALLQVKDIAHQFHGLHVLKGVSFSVAERSVTGLIGPNGAGKSTLFNIISGFLRPTSGQILYLGKTITNLSIQRRSYAGLVRTFQTPQVFSELTVRENLIAGCYKQGHTGFVKSLLSLPEVLLRETGLFLIAYTALVGWLGTRQIVPKLLVVLVVAGNAAWTIASIALLFSGAASPNLLGEIVVVATGGREGAAELLGPLERTYHPNRVVVCYDPATPPLDFQ